MRTTIRLDDQLWAELKQWAAQSGRTLSAVVEDALRLSLARHKQRANAPKVSLLSDRGQGLQPGVDLDNSATLLDLMEGVTPENIHEAIDFGPPVGKEVW